MTTASEEDVLKTITGSIRIIQKEYLHLDMVEENLEVLKKNNPERFEHYLIKIENMFDVVLDRNIKTLKQLTYETFEQFYKRMD